MFICSKKKKKMWQNFQTSYEYIQYCAIFKVLYLSISIFYFMLPHHYINWINVVTSYFADSDYSVFIGY